MPDLRRLPLLLAAAASGGVVLGFGGAAVASGGLAAATLAAGAVLTALAGGAGWWAGTVARTRAVARLHALADEIAQLRVDRARLSEVRTEPERRIVVAVNQLAQAWASERRASQADARLLSSLVSGSPNGVLVVGNDGRVRLMNGAFRTLFGVRGEPVGRPPAEVVASPEVLDLLDLSGGQVSADELFTVVGSRDILVRSLVTEAGEVAVLAQDVTRFRAAERARTAFVANVSHELRTPMAAILGYAEALNDDIEELPAPSRPLVEAVVRNGRRLRDTFEGLMNLARIEARSGQLPLEGLRLAPLLAEAVAPAVDEAARKGVSIEVVCGDEIAAATNPEAFEVIVRNLATNAVKYTPSGGRVAIAVHDLGHEVRVEVQDSGIGIDAAHHERIFERFFRVDEGRARQAGGIGLGLAMVKHLCLATGARVAVHSRADRGSTFVVSFPPASAVERLEGEE